MYLTQKERYLLEDQKSHEELCIKKYSNYANQAKDPQLKQIFTQLGNQEQEHLNTINQIMDGQIPNVNQQQQQGMQNQQNQSMSQSGMKDQSDADLCTDLLATEKYISSTYNTAIFEFTDTNIRKVLNHIQKEEQEHGEKIFNYMQSHGMYDVQ
ncbi:spore coat protein [Clostridiisalibacter paucivorans]|uniref:spore coat protein n=1 Tax=Clostridiisalibacter paucivorans TaxID=408753 RepID=UPI00047AD1E3|nr:spore coat protein [Clostridiisalibacter paucivorans]